MNYMLLIYGDPNQPLSEAEEAATMGDYYAFTQSIIDSGEMVAGDPLHGIETASAVTVRNGATVVTDGPFAETKEVLGGYYIVNVDSVTRAQELAAQIPTAKWGTIEVRAVMELPADMGH